MHLFSRINRFHRQYMAKVTVILAPYELTPANWSLLQFLHDNEMATSSQIAEYWQVEKPTVAANVKALLQKEYITIITGEDKRTKQLVLTAAGEEMYAQLQPQIITFQQTLLASISPDLQQLFSEAFIQMESTLKELS